MSINNKALEPMIKDFVIHNEFFFGDLGQNIVLSEKSMGRSNQRNIKETIADLLIFSEKKGLVGVEIKTEYDTLQRLNRQMKGYSLVCDYIYVVAHDKHVEGIEDRLRRYKHKHVGIIAYREFKGTIIGGVYKEATKNPKKSIFHTVNILWKKDIVRILGGLRFPSRVAERELGVKNLKDKNRKSHMGAPAFSNKMRKRELINNLLARFGPEETNRLVCKFFIHNSNPEKVLNLKHFDPSNFKGNGSKANRKRGE